ncbi:TPA: restriction endonuclease subunit S [Vibrio parahaemolyticus]|nr:restriction endonuclease subunit S [Vibrio parahaemolyticus]
MKTMKIPSGWKLCKQSDVSAFYNGRAYKLSEWETEGTPVIRLQNLTGTGNEYYYSNLKLPVHQYADNGDLLYMWSATFGPKIWQGEKAIYHYHIWKVVCKDDLLDQSFMYYNLDFITESMKSKTNGSTMLHFTKKGMEEHEILLPPLVEQEKIAEYLSTVDKKIDLIDQKIAETEKLKTGLMQKLFSEGVGVQDENGNWQPHTEFQASPFGNVPKCWLKVSLENIASVERGKFSARPRNDPKYFGGNIPFVQTGDVVNAQLYVESYSQTLNELGLTVSKTFPTETILITIAANIGDVAITQFPLACPDSLVGIQAKKDICDSLWLFFFMQTQKSELDSKATKSAQKNINLQVLKPLTVFLPPLEEQEFIAEILLASEKKIALLKQQKTETQQLKKGLMQKLLTGEWRVPVEETEEA